MIYITPTIFLKPLSIDDTDSLFYAIDSERDDLRTWLPFVEMTQEIQDTQNYIKQFLLVSDMPQFCIYEQEQLIGSIGFKDYEEENHRVEIGYWLSQKMRGQGIMTRSVSSLLELAFTRLNINRIQIRAAVHNEKSRKIPERLGFTFEGVERDGELLIDGFTDLALYSLLKREYFSIDSRNKI